MIRSIIEDEVAMAALRSLSERGYSFGDIAEVYKTIKLETCDPAAGEPDDPHGRV